MSKTQIKDFIGEKHKHVSTLGHQTHEQGSKHTSLQVRQARTYVSTQAHQAREHGPT